VKGTPPSEREFIMNTNNIENNLEHLINKKTIWSTELKTLTSNLQNKLFQLEERLESIQYMIATLQEAQKEIQAINDQPCDRCSNLGKGIQWCMKSGCLQGTVTDIQYPLFQSNTDPIKEDQKIDDQIVHDLKSEI
jgi:conjugal transfer/entry exclusion protein